MKLFIAVSLSLGRKLFFVALYDKQESALPVSLMFEIFRWKLSNMNSVNDHTQRENFKLLSISLYDDVYLQRFERIKLNSDGSLWIEQVAVNSSLNMACAFTSKRFYCQKIGFSAKNIFQVVESMLVHNLKLRVQTLRSIDKGISSEIFDNKTARFCLVIYWYSLLIF